MPAIFQLWITKKINKALSVRVIVICSGHINFYGGTLIKVLVAHQHRLSLYCTRLLLLYILKYKLKLVTFLKVLTCLSIYMSRLMLKVLFNSELV